MRGKFRITYPAQRGFHDKSEISKKKDINNQSAMNGLRMNHLHPLKKTGEDTPTPRPPHAKGKKTNHVYRSF